MKKVVILGSTGSIGRNSLRILERFPRRFSVAGLSAGRNAQLLYEQAVSCRPELVAIAEETLASSLTERLSPLGIKVITGSEGLVQLAEYPESDIVINALVGAVGVIPTLKAIQRGKDVALANKEAIVMAGEIITEETERQGVNLIPINSEISAIWQCLGNSRPKGVKRLILTASGGPFLNLSKQELDKVKPSDALAHPTWQMGKKITVDSATLMNKGLEVIEAHWFFKFPSSQIDVVIHPQSTIHSMVEFVDGSIMAQLSVPDMRLPVQYALTFPEKLESEGRRMDFSEGIKLTFEPPDLDRFECLKLAYQAAEIGGTMPAVLNAANEVVVEAFLKGQLSFTKIPKAVEKAMNKHKVSIKPDLEEILEADSWARSETRNLIKTEP